MNPEQSWPLVPSAVRASVEAIVSSVVTPAELDTIVVGWSSRSSGSLSEPVEVAARDDEVMLWAWVSVAGETFRCPLWEPDSVAIEQWLEAFADQLEDFFAESRFAWGQQRLVPRPWTTSGASSP